MGIQNQISRTLPNVGLSIFKMKIMKKQTGIWLDTKEATLIELTDQQTPQIHHIRSSVSTAHAKGGSRSASPWGPTSVISESKILEKRKHQKAGYFEKIMAAVKDSDEVFIFGPAQAKDKLLHAIKENRQQFHQR